jgi:hypothetical protein
MFNKVLEVMDNIEVWSKETPETPEIKAKKLSRKPWRAGILFSTKSMMEQTEILLNEEGYDFVCPGKMDQNGLENFHSLQRFKHKNPTAAQYMSNLKKINFSKFIQPTAGASYEHVGSLFLIDNVHDYVPKKIAPLKPTHDVSYKDNNLQMHVTTDEMAPTQACSTNSFSSPSISTISISSSTSNAYSNQIRAYRYGYCCKSIGKEHPQLLRCGFCLPFIRLSFLF